MLTWRKTYRKYKPRTTPGKCNVCAKKAVRQAYCTVCRPCAQTHGVCEKCGQKPKEGKVQAPQSKEEQLADRWTETIGGGRNTQRRISPGFFLAVAISVAPSSNMS